MGMHEVGTKEPETRYAWKMLTDHFGTVSVLDIVASRRRFSDFLRADLQATVSELVGPTPRSLVGVYQQHTFFPLSIGGLLLQHRDKAVEITPLQYQDVNIGEDISIPCLETGLWLVETDGVKFAVLLSLCKEGPARYVEIEIAGQPGPAGSALVARLVKKLEEALRTCKSYRGKTLSYEAQSQFTGEPSGLFVHRIPPVPRDAVILDPMTMDQLDKNVFEFDRNRDGLKRLGQSTRKGILLYGPPGTGKTHAIRYISSNLPERTTILITADEVKNLRRYMDLARTLQPSVVVIEDVDLIGRSRERMDNPGVESLLNMLLNEMDGLRDDAEILFILTTNRPEQIEDALASRPGRIDQAIEIPLPDAVCRKRLIHLYGKRLDFDNDAVTKAVERTANVSAAFIKEMVRRFAQRSLGHSPETEAARITRDDVDAVLDDMLGAGGPLGRRLLGAAEAVA